MSCGEHAKCDERCQYASTVKCSCACGGVNHGIALHGQKVYEERMEEWNEQLLEEEGLI